MWHPEDLTRLCPTLGAAILAAVVAAVGVVSSAAPPADPGRAFLGAAFHLSAAELTKIDAGQVVARTLDVKNHREVATLGIVRIKTTPAAYIERLNDIVNFKRGADVIQIGKFSSPPQGADLASLTIDADDMKDLRGCRIGDCDVRLPAETIDRLSKEIDWRAPEAAARATAIVREMLLQYVTRYREAGSSAAMIYASTKPPFNTGQEFTSLMMADMTTWQYVPALRQHLIDYPMIDRERSSDFIYWSKERANGEPLLSITHVAIVRLDEDAPVRYAAASKQIYAMHYYDASLGLTLLIPDPGASPAATYVVYLNRSRVDLFDGFFGGIARRIVAGKARSLVADLLARLQKSFES